MESLRIEILNPKVKTLLKNLADMNLIKINSDQKESLKDLLKSIRLESDMKLTETEIADEVNKVRKSRYGK